MRDTYLFVSDGYTGSDGESWQLLADMLLCESPARPLAFHISSRDWNTPAYLHANCSREIIGKKAGTIVLCLGWQELTRPNAHWERTRADFQLLLQEIAKNSQARVICTTVYAPHHEPIAPWNTVIREHAPECVDFAAICEHYQEQQAMRGEFRRNLADSSGEPGHLGRMLFALSVKNILTR